MNLCDTNVWVALALSGHVHHARARDWLDGVDAADRIVFCRATQQGLLRLLTNSSVLAPYGNPPLTNSEAWAVFDAFLGDDRVSLMVHEPPGVDDRWRALSAVGEASPKLWMDAYLAAFSTAAGCRLVTTDSGFRRFSTLDVELIV